MGWGLRQIEHVLPYGGDQLEDKSMQPKLYPIGGLDDEISL